MIEMMLNTYVKAVKDIEDDKKHMTLAEIFPA